MNPIEQQIRLVMLAMLVGVIGCSGDALNVQPKPTDIVQRDLTPAERALRKTLYEQLRADLRVEPYTSKSPHWERQLEGTPAAKYQPFLDLADKTERFEDKLCYEFVFRTESESDPKRFQEGDAWINIVVEDCVITHASYHVMVR